MFFFCVSPLIHTKQSIYTSQDMRKVAGRGSDGGGPYVQALYISRLNLSTPTDQHNLVCLQHRLWSKLGWLH